MPEGKVVQQMFGQIADQYDKANLYLSLGVDRWWRRKLVREILSHPTARHRDLACGSGDVLIALGKAREISPDWQIEGLDFCQPLLDIAAQRLQKEKLPTLPLTCGDILNLPFPENSCDSLSMAFGLRNLEDRPRGLRECLRILRPGGHLHVLEFTQPKPWFAPFYNFYLHRMLPTLAGWITGKREAYQYLATSIGNFPDSTSLSREFMDAGFAEVKVNLLTGGIVAIHSGKKA